MQRLLIVGFGDIARRAAPQLERRFGISSLSRQDGFDLDRPETLRFEGADAVLHLAPPPRTGDSDPRTANLLAALEKGRILPARLVYVSTSGVYGDCGGARVDESRPIAPATPRAWIADLVSKDLYSVMSESRRLDNRRFKHELGVHLRYPTVHEGLKHAQPAGVDQSS